MTAHGDGGPLLRDPPQTTIVTGASGWLGQALSRALAQRNGHVRCLVRSPIEAAMLDVVSQKISTLVGDVRNPQDLDRLFADAAGATIFHAAAVIHPRGGTRQFFDVNVGGTALTLDRARRAEAARFVYVSSNSPFGTNPSSEQLFDENAPYRPSGGYGRSKMEAELLVRKCWTTGDLDTVIVRCPWFYGPYQPPRQSRFFALVRRGLFPLIGHGQNRRSLAYTDNLVQGLLRAELVEGAAGRAYWIADERPYTMSEIVAAARGALEAEGIPVVRKQIRLPDIVSIAADRADRALQKVGRYSSELHVLGEMGATIACSISRAQRELGYDPKIAIDEGMRRSIRWCIAMGEFFR